MWKMRLRAIHLASVLLLLASLSSADGAVLHDGEYTLGAHYIRVLLAQQEAAAGSQTTLDTDADEALALDLPVASVAQYRATWTMRPPSAHSVSLHAVTGSGI